MKRFLALILCLSSLLWAACSFIDGVSVTLSRDSLSALKAEVIPFLLAKGFKPQAPANEFNSSFYLRLSSDSNPPHYVYANFYSDDKSHSFFIGKGNTHHFFADEIKIIDECAAFLAEHSAIIDTGFASTRATSSDARERFYAKIKKRG